MNRIAAAASFCPPWWLRNPHLQSILASSSWRRWLLARRARDLRRRAQWLTLDCGAGVRLSACCTAQRRNATPRGMVVLLHGWEGSVRSAYILQTGARLLAEGWDVLRLNFRDHGGSHALNPGIFHSCRLDEVVGALRAVKSLYPTRPLAVIGYSLGGNFALRVALAAPAAGLALARVIAVCPAINPHSVLDRLEHAPRIYHAYFMHKWRRSLRAKQRAFPDRELFTRRDLAGNLRALTETLVLKHTDFGSLTAYLDGYSLAADRLAGLRVPASILATRDDPICPWTDLATLALPACVQVTVAEHGGHCGFIADWRLASWAEDYIVAQLDQRAQPQEA